MDFATESTFLATEWMGSETKTTVSVWEQTVSAREKMGSEPGKGDSGTAHTSQEARSLCATQPQGFPEERSFLSAEDSADRDEDFAVGQEPAVGYSSRCSST